MAAIGGPVTEAVAHLESFVLGGGKRIRPLYAWAGFVGGGGLERGTEDPAAMLRAAASLEFIQACALIHDDIIDSSDTRRGNATVHRAVEKQHRDRSWAGDPAHFGESVAILVGDLALVWAEDMLQDSGLSVEALQRAREPWRGMRTEVIGGQLLDITLEATADENIGLADSVNRFKTAAYTIERPCTSGPPSRARTRPPSTPSAATAMTSASPSSSATTSSVSTATRRSPASLPATTCGRASAPSCSPPPCSVPTSAIPPPPPSCAPVSAPRRPRRSPAWRRSSRTPAPWRRSRSASTPLRSACPPPPRHLPEVTATLTDLAHRATARRH